MRRPPPFPKILQEAAAREIRRRPRRRRREPLPEPVDTRAYLSEEGRDFIVSTLRELLTEERTDRFIAALVSRLPSWARLLPVAYILDLLLPEIFFEIIGELMDEASGRRGL